MYANETLNQISGQNKDHENTAKVDILVKMFWSVNAELEAIADEVPSEDSDVDLMIERELNLYAEKAEIVQSLKNATVANVNDSSAISKVLEEEALSIPTSVEMKNSKSHIIAS